MDVTSLEDQEKLLDEAVKCVKTHALGMKRCLDQNQVMEGINHSSLMLDEMRTSLLSPKSYYMLYMAVSDELMHLNQFLTDEYSKGRKLPDLYEVVQYCGNIVPRLYLLVTVGTAYIKVREGSRKNILKDIVEMLRGVQNPLRGLFLRNYLLQCTRLLLPDIGQEVEQYGDGLVGDSIEFILLNFAEMNKLWVRMQYQGHSSKKDLREKERLELRVLVGTNLVRLSDIQGIDASMYKDTVLPSLLDQIIRCKDSISQEYLLECIISVFPDDFHLQTLNLLLSNCKELHEKVAIRKIIISLVERLIKYSKSNESTGIPEDIKIFEIFSKEVPDIVQEHKSIDIVDGLAMLASVLNLGITIYPDITQYVDQILLSSLKFIQTVPEEDMTNITLKELLKLLKIPIDSYNNVLRLLSLANYSTLMARLGYQHRKDLSIYICQNLIETNIYLHQPQEVEDILVLISPLIEKQSDEPAGEAHPEDFAEEQNLVGQVLHRFVSPVSDQQYHILNTCKKHFASGGESRQRYTYPPLVFSAMKLVWQYYNNEKDDDTKWSKKVQHIFQFISQIIHDLSKGDLSELAMRLFVQAALCADRVKAETIAYEFISQAFMIYEEEISDSKAQLSAINIIIGCVEQLRNLDEENHETLRSKCAVTSNKLLRKSNQCRAVALCSNLFWSCRVAEKGDTPLQDGQRVVECLRKSLKIANQCMEAAAQVQLFIEVLNWFMYYYEQDCQTVTYNILEQLIRKINDSMPQLSPNEESEQIHKHFQLTIQHIVHLQKLSEGSEDNARYAQLKIL